MKLYWFDTMNPRKACATAKHLGLAVDYERASDLHAADYLAINPNGLAPALLDGELRLWESAAIAVHLAVKAGSDMWPSQPAAQVEVLRWISWDACHWSRSVGAFYFEHFIKPKFGLGAPDRSQLGGAAANVERFGQILDAQLAERKFVTGATLTVADFCLAAMLADWRAHEIPLEPFANVRRWNDELLALPAWRDPWPV